MSAPSPESRCKPSDDPEGYTGVIPPGKSGSGELNGQESPADRLRLAANLIDQRAAAATPGPWQPEHAYGNPNRVQAVFVDCTATDGCDHRDCIDGTHGIGGFDRDGDNRWALTVDPRVGPLLAELLRAAANGVDRFLVPGAGTEVWRHELAIADQILSGDQ